MNLWYNLIDYLPFEWANYLFMKNALLSVLIITPVFGLLGTTVVNNRMAFYSEALGHSALTGIAIGVILGFKDPLISMIIFSIFLAIGISYIKSLNTSSADTVIGVFSATAVSVGIVILSKGGGFNKYSAYLIGDLLSITPKEVLLLGTVLTGVALVWCIIYNKLLLISINTSFAHSRGINTRLMDVFFAIIMAITVTVSIQWLGLLIITSLLVLPAAAARNISKNATQYTLISLSVSLSAGLSGLILSYYWGTATGATIVVMAACLFSFSFLYKIVFH